MYAPDPSDDAGWQAKLGNELRDPEFEMSYRGGAHPPAPAVLRRVVVVLLAAWIARITVFEASETWEQTSSILTIPGQVVTGIVVGFYVLVLRGGRVVGPRRESQEFQE